MSTRPRDRPGESGGVRGCPPHLGLRVYAEKAVKKDPQTLQSFVPVSAENLSDWPDARGDCESGRVRVSDARDSCRDDSRTDPRSRRYAASDPPRGELFYNLFCKITNARGDSTPASGEGGAAVGDQGFSRRSSLEWVRSSASYPLTSVRRCMLRVNRGKCGPGWAAMVWSVHRRSRWHRYSRCSRGNSERSRTERGSRCESGLGQSCCACLKANILDSSHDGLID